MRRKRTLRTRNLRIATLGACIGAVVAGAASAQAQATSSTDTDRLQKLEQENQDLHKRLDALEAVAKKEGIMPSDSASPPAFPLKVFSESKLSGFVSTSYFYDTSSPPGRISPGYLWNQHDNSFTLNKIKLTLEKPVERSGDKWDAGYRVSLIFGNDAKYVDIGSGQQGFEEVREAFVDLNVPIGTGLDIKAGQLISLLNFESGDGGPSNPNFSQGNQWYFTGNGPAAGVQASYAFSDLIDFTARVQNGLYTGAVDNNGFKTVMGSLGIHPDKKTSLNLLGFGGREGAASGQWLKGASFIGNRQLVESCNLNFATEFDYFSQDVGAGSSDWWSIGGWLWADLTPKIGLALRADYLSDPDGTGTGGLLGFPVGIPGQDLTSVTFTVNLRPIPSIKIQPEIRYDHTSLANGFGTQKDRFIIGMGASYSF
jgi:hypothetical protein